MKEFIIKLFIGMVVSSITKEQAVAAWNSIKAQMAAKVKESGTQWDDIAFAGFLANEDGVIDLLQMCIEVADDKVKESGNTMDAALWLPISVKLNEILAEIK